MIDLDRPIHKRNWKPEMQTRAKAGGEFGANGEFYEGGKFINTIPKNSKRLGSKPKTERKAQIEPYVWVVAPDEKRSIFTAISGIYAQVSKSESGQWIATLRTDDRLETTCRYYGVTVENASELVDRFNAGERWV